MPTLGFVANQVNTHLARQALVTAADDKKLKREEIRRATHSSAVRGHTIHFNFVDEADLLQTDIPDVEKAIGDVSARFPLPGVIHIYCQKSASSRGIYAHDPFSSAEVHLWLAGIGLRANPVDPDFTTAVEQDMGKITGGVPVNGVKSRTVGHRLFDEERDPAKKRGLLVRVSVYHELGHVLHQQHSIVAYQSLAEQWAEDSIKKNLDDQRRHFRELRPHQRKVSWYATSHPNEFIAETFSGLMAGEKYSSDLFDAYVELGGHGADAAKKSFGKVSFD